MLILHRKMTALFLVFTVNKYFLTITRHCGVPISCMEHNICAIVHWNRPNKNQPLAVLCSEAAHYSASDGCWWSILWLRAEWKRILTVCCLMGWGPVGQCVSLYSYFSQNPGMFGVREWRACECRKHKLPLIWMSRTSVSNSPIRKQHDGRIHRRNAM